MASVQLQHFEGSAQVQDGVDGQVVEVGFGSGGEGCWPHRTWLSVSHGSQFLVRGENWATFSLTHSRGANDQHRLQKPAVISQPRRHRAFSHGQDGAWGAHAHAGHRVQDCAGAGVWCGGGDGEG